jgi:hypothetical protein
LRWFGILPFGTFRVTTPQRAIANRNASGLWIYFPVAAFFSHSICSRWLGPSGEIALLQFGYPKSDCADEFVDLAVEVATAPNTLPERRAVLTVRLNGYETNRA